MMAGTSPSEAVITAWARLLRARNVVLGAVEADLKAAGFPPLEWYDLLLELKRAGAEGLRPFEFEGRLLLAQHNVSRLVDRLQKAGLVERRPHEQDGRGQIVVITETGLDLQRRMWPVYRQSIQRHVGSRLADEADAEQLGALLGKLLGASCR